MATATLKNIPDDLYSALRLAAAQHRRSINKEAIACLEAALREQRPGNGSDLRERIRAHREGLKRVSLDKATVDAAKRDGRP